MCIKHYGEAAFEELEEISRHFDSLWTYRHYLDQQNLSIYKAELLWLNRTQYVSVLKTVY